MSTQDVSAKVTVDISGYKKGMGEAAQETAKLGEAAQQSARDLANAGQAQRQAAEDIEQSVRRASNAALDAFNGSTDGVLRLAGMLPGLGAALGTAAAAVGVLGAAFLNGDAESAQFHKTLALTGNAAGMTASQMMGLAREIDGVAGTQAAASEVINKLVVSGGVAAGQMGNVATAIAAMSDAGAGDVDTLVDQFARLRDEPTKGILALHDAYNFLTPAVYDQIRALEEEGRKEEAAALAQKTASAALDERAREVEKATGLMERAWGGVLRVVKETWDAMLDIGRESPIDALIESQKKHIAWLEEVAADQGPLSGGSIGAQSAAALKAAKDSLAVLEQRKKALEDEAKAEADAARAVKAHVQQVEALDAYTGRFGSTQEKANIAVAEWRAKLGAAFTPEMEAKVRATFDAATKGAKSSGAAARAAGRDFDVLGEFIKDLEWYEKEAAKAADELSKNLAGTVGALEERALSLEEELATYGQTEAQIAATTAQRYEEVRALAKAGGASDDYLANLDREIDARKRIAAAAGSLEARQVADDAAQDAAAEWKRTADQIEDSLTDALMRGFESGEDFGENLEHALTNMFKTLVLRPLIQPVAQGMAGMVTGALGTGNGQGGSGWLGNLQSGASTLQTGAQLYSGVGASTASLIGANAVGAFGGDAMGAMIAGNAGTWGVSSAGVSGAAGMMGTVAAAMPYVAIALAVLSMIDWGGGTPHAGAAVFAGPDGVKSPRSYAETQGYYADPADADGFGEKDFYKRRQQGIADALSPVAEGAAGILNGALSAFGQAANYRVGLAFSSDDDDASRGRFSVINNAGAEVGEFVRKYDSDPQKGFEQFATDLGGSLRDALVAADLPGWVDDILTSLGDAPSMEQLSAVMDELSAFVDGAVTQGDAWRKATESLSDQFAALGVTMPRSTQEFSALVQASGELGAELYALAPAFYQLSSVVEQTFASISRTAAESVRDIELSLLDNAGKYAYLDVEIDGLLAQLEAAFDPATVQGLFEQINAKTVAAYNLLDETAQRGNATAFIDRLYEAEALAQSRLSVAPLEDVATRQAEAGERAAAALNAAADRLLAVTASLGADAASGIRAAADELRGAAGSLQVSVRMVGSEVGY